MLQVNTVTDTWILICLNLSIYGIMLFKFTCFWRTNSYSLAFRLYWHTFQNQSCVSRKSKICKWKKLNDSVLINYLITLFTTISSKCTKEIIIHIYTNKWQIEEQSDQGLHCLLFNLHLFYEIPQGLASLFEFFR